MRDSLLETWNKAERRHGNQLEDKWGWKWSYSSEGLFSKLFTVRSRIREMQSFEGFLDLYKPKLSSGDTTYTIVL